VIAVEVVDQRSRHRGGQAPLPAADTNRSCPVMITAVGTSTPPIQSGERNAYTADVADSAVSNGVRRKPRTAQPPPPLIEGQYPEVPAQHRKPRRPVEFTHRLPPFNGAGCSRTGNDLPLTILTPADISLTSR
jgi:hypothetical protein